MKKKFDAVAYQREQREKLGKEYQLDRDRFLRELREKYGQLKRSAAPTE